MTQPISFSLRPFEATVKTQSIAIAGMATREGDRLSLKYRLQGDRHHVVLPSAREDGPPLSEATRSFGHQDLRQNYLWEQTCFEFFVAGGTTHRNDHPYWEFNLSPSGAWNVFSLTSYRQDTAPSPAFQTLPFSVVTTDEAWQLEVSIDLTQLLPAGTPIQLGVSSVVVLRASGAEPVQTFWAIAHCAPEADFHHPDSFVLAL